MSGTDRWFVRDGIVILAAISGWVGQNVHAAGAEQAKRDFFESRIRPVLVDQCYSCHNSADAAEGELEVDHRGGLLKGGTNGPAVVPGRPDESLLLKAVRHEIDGLQMPQDAPQLEERVIADFEQWIADGAIDPRDAPPSADEFSQLTSWQAVRDRRMQWWSFQPITDPAPPVCSERSLRSSPPATSKNPSRANPPWGPDPPEVERGEWSDNPIDRFVLSKMQDAGLAPSPLADRRTLIRRLTFALIGLPPSPDQIERFLHDASPDAYARLVDDLLASGHFGEHWARHWMDWVRYAETHGSEGDPAIPHAWRYRDYLIRALNADVPYDQLIREHLAGDLLLHPRINDELGINESMLGAAQYRFVQHGFAPTDALDEQVRFTDNQIDVISKAFLGLTVSCARCHNHKFDPISQADFYALYGVMISSRPATVTIDTPARQDTHRKELTRLKQRLRELLAEQWLAAAGSVAEHLQSPEGPWAEALKQTDDVTNPLRAWSRLSGLSGEEFAAQWLELASEFEQSQERLQKRSSESFPWKSDLSQPDDYAKWYRHGTGLRNDQPAPAGEFATEPEGERIVTGIFPAGVYSNLLSTKHNGVLASRRIHLDAEHLYLRVRGDGEARARYVVQHYPRRGTVYPIQILKDGRGKWVHWDMTYWQGDDIDIEVCTAADLPVELNIDAVRSSFGVTEAVLLSESQRASGLAPRDELAEFAAPLFAAAMTNQPSDTAGLAAHYANAVTGCVAAWRDDTMSDGQARYLDFFVRENLLPNRLSAASDIASVVEEYRTIEADVPIPTRAPGVLEADVIDQPLFVRGNHKQPGDPVPRRFLEALGPHSYDGDDSGRLELAEDILRLDNPLTARVIVNRVWHHLFGRGIVATPDNFGHLGAEPSHPELLDWLAVRFVEDGWSLKKLIRRIVSSRTYQLASVPSASAAAGDPDNVWLSHAPLRRLEAEAIRDAMLAASGELDTTFFGPPQKDDSSRRSIYLPVKRNEMVPFLAVFDQPTPFSTKGRRDVTNVPGQSLTLMNDPFVHGVASRWAERLLRERGGVDDSVMIQRMFVSALGRSPSAEELDWAKEFITAAAETYAAEHPDDGRHRAWQELAMVIFNLKEFIYVR